MCGIAGIVGCEPLGGDTRMRALRMRDIITHRGPDEAGLHWDGTAALAHRRLSIVDVSTGQQPLANEDGSVWVVFNGEIYNHGEIRRELEARGHTYRTRSDTETIVHAYEEWGDEAVHRFRGMFAFAIWDAPPSPRPRSPRDQTRVLVARRRRGAVRIGNQGHPRQRSRRAGRQRDGDPGAARDALYVGQRHAVHRHPQAASRTPAGVRARRGQHSPVLGHSGARRRGRAAVGAGRRRPVPFAAHRVGEAPVDERSAARHVSVRPRSWRP